MAALKASVRRATPSWSISEARWNLLENVAARIVDAIEGAGLGFWFVQVRVSKKNPPVGGVCAWSRVTATSGADILENNGINETF